jgi:acid phosphatase type 7
MRRLAVFGSLIVVILAALFAFHYVIGSVRHPPSFIRKIARFIDSVFTMVGGVTNDSSSVATIPPPTDKASAPSRDGPRDPILMAAGDIACKPSSRSSRGGQGSPQKCHMLTTADLIQQIHPDVALTLGDNQYAAGALEEYQQVFDLSWGRFKTIIHPVAGNHEYHLAGATDYYAYFGTAAGTPSRGYYGFDVEHWHLIALNSECNFVGGCGVGSSQEVWLKNDLAANSGKCLLAYWHEPRFSSGAHGSNRVYMPFWQDLYAAHTDIVLSAHDHVYERFDLQDANGIATPDGIRVFVVGTGGARLHQFKPTQANSQARNAESFGVLELALHASSYDWYFVPEAGGTCADSGTAACHN